MSQSCRRNHSFLPIALAIFILLGSISLSTNSYATGLGLEEHGAFLWAECAALDAADSLLLAAYPNGLRFFRETAPGEFVLLGQVPVLAGIKQVVRKDAVAYCLDGAGLIRVLDLSDWRNPVWRSALDPTRTWSALVVEGDWLFAGANGRLKSFDITDPRHPAAAGWWDFDGPLHTLVAADSLLLLTQQDATLLVAVRHADGGISPTARLVFGDGYPVLDVATDGSHAWLPRHGSGVLILDVRNPYAPIVVSHIPISGATGFVGVSGGRLLVSDSLFGLISYRLSNPAAPLWQYETLEFLSVDHLWPSSSGRFYLSQGDAVRALDVAPTGRITVAGSFSHPGGYRTLVERDGWVYIHDDYGLWKARTDSLDSDSSFARLIDSWPVYDVRIDGDYLVTANGRNGVAATEMGPGGYLGRQYFVGTGSSVTSTVSAFDTLITLENGYGFEIFEADWPRSEDYLGRKRRARTFLDGVLRSGRYLYLSERGGGVKIYDLRHPVKPRTRGTFAGSYLTEQLLLAGHILYAADRSMGITVYDVGNPTRPVPVDNLPWPDSATTLLVSGRTLYVGDVGGNVTAIDFAQLSAGRVIARIRLPAAVQRLEKRGERLIVTTRAAVHAVDVTPHLTPGDFSTDGILDATDLVALIEFVFRSGNPSFRPNAADVNGDGIVNLVDVVRMIGYLFDDGPALVPGTVE